jgi:dTDP-4-dehydrorhamnose reductase
MEQRSPAHIAGLTIKRSKPSGFRTTRRLLSREAAEVLSPVGAEVLFPVGAEVVEQSRLERPSPDRVEFSASWGFTCEPTYFLRQTVKQRISCRRGELFLVVVDLRVGSPSFRQWQSFLLSEHDARSIHLPAGVACGWQVLSEIATVRIRYNVHPDAHDQRWLRWNDLLLDLPWPHIPQELAAHPRPSLSLLTLDEHQLPQYTTPVRTQCQADFGTPSVDVASPVGVVSRAPQVSKTSLASSASSPSLTPAVAGSPLPKSRRSQKPSPTERPILLLGCNGQLGRDLHQHLRNLGVVVGACRNPENCRVLPAPMRVDVTRPASLRQAIRSVRPMLIVNATGLTDIALGEQAPRQAQAVNANAPQVVIEEAERLDCGVVHFCSSLVFDGEGDAPYNELSPTVPINQVGRTKLVGTQGVLSSCIPHIVFRSSWLFGSHERNFVSECLDQLAYRNTISLAEDQRGTPTPTRWLAQTVADVLTRVPREDLNEWLEQIGGLYHLAPVGYASRVDVGDQLMAVARGLGMPVVTGKILGADLDILHPHLPVPRNQQLNCAKFAATFATELPRWQSILNQQVVDSLGHDARIAMHVA